MRGRKPTPTALKLRRGNPGKRALPKNEPKPIGPVTCPDWLSQAAKTEWRRIAPVLVKAGIVTAADRAALAVYCQQYARVASAERLVEEQGPIVKSPSGYPIQNPNLAIANKAATLLIKYAAELGITPSSRTRVEAVPGTGKAGTQGFARQEGGAQ